MNNALPTDSDAPKTDDQTSVTELKQVVGTFVAERDWHRFHTPKNLAMSLAIETAELMEHFQWLTPEESLRVMDDPESRVAVGEEVADCLAYLLAIASKLDIDLATTLKAKMIRNAEKYPVEGNKFSRDNQSGS
ncbi:NTP pyrophosphatase (non-canonical NTP hydrolase) [Rhodopirellula rubra]|uniref:NTP pyrophosphatase (Non-canonical NTP hydrolase) n=1 Tax=Aporhodopirellula rubra TaxID=980271 RepID=A0A7W5DUS1_9BACT|nr:nucleotide pyrophosphohydrolase [Aporhodopirellula rubra]MBB3204544.1 NTP pyrophosphatase (non-canonical NTP hydrolase) [Aporhodopirellula rubra]